MEVLVLSGHDGEIELARVRQKSSASASALELEETETCEGSVKSANRV